MPADDFPCGSAILAVAEIPLWQIHLILSIFPQERVGCLVDYCVLVSLKFWQVGQAGHHEKAMENWRVLNETPGRGGCRGERRPIRSKLDTAALYFLKIQIHKLLRLFLRKAGRVIT